MTSLNPVFTGEQIAESIRGLHQGASHEEALAEAKRIPISTIPSRRRFIALSASVSGGRQRVMIAMALSCRPAVLDCR